MATASQPRPSLAEEGRELTRDRILNAVGELLGEHSWERVSMAQVADLAGVSRQTLYNSFGSRPDLARAYVEREADVFMDAVEAAFLAGERSPREMVALALEIFLSAVQTHPLVAAIASGEADELLGLVTSRGGPLVDRVNERLIGLMLTRWPDVSRVDASEVSDTVVRLAISHATLPGGLAKETAQSVARMLGPYVEELAT